MKKESTYAILIFQRKDNFIYYYNEKGTQFEVLLTMYDNRLECTYTVFTDSEEGDLYGTRYFAAIYDSYGSEAIRIFPLSEEEKDSLYPILCYEHGIIEPLDYFDYYA